MLSSSGFDRVLFLFFLPDAYFFSLSGVGMYRSFPSSLIPGFGGCCFMLVLNKGGLHSSWLPFLPFGRDAGTPAWIRDVSG